MKLSDAILVGSTVMQPKSGAIADGDGAGCALGMAAIGMGFGLTAVPEAGPFKRTANAEIMGEWLNNEVRRPCSFCCWRGPRTIAVKEVIAHLFDIHVMQKRDWTIDQLAAWVATVEPQEADQEQPEGGVGTHPTEQSSETCCVEERSR